MLLVWWQEGHPDCKKVSGGTEQNIFICLNKLTEFTTHKDHNRQATRKAMWLNNAGGPNSNIHQQSIYGGVLMWLSVWGEVKICMCHVAQLMPLLLTISSPGNKSRLDWFYLSGKTYLVVPD